MAGDCFGRRCSHCGRWIPEPLTRCRRRTCPGYGYLWAGDQRRKLFVNLQSYSALAACDREPQVLLSAVTAPGADQLPWDERHCDGLGEHEHSGSLGCRVRSVPAAAWNLSAPERWRSLHRAVGQRCRRDGAPVWLLARVWELQHRGALHVHPVLAFTTPAEKRAARLYVAHLAELAPAFGFGYVERKITPMRAQAAAAYLSSYFIAGRGRKASLEESVRSRAMPRSIVHLSNRLTTQTGCTMRALRRLRFLNVRGGFELCAGDSYHLVDAYEAHPTCWGIRKVRAQEVPCAAP